jgi:hypothetical protein
MTVALSLGLIFLAVDSSSEVLNGIIGLSVRCVITFINACVAVAATDLYNALRVGQGG